MLPTFHSMHALIRSIALFSLIYLFAMIATSALAETKTSSTASQPSSIHLRFDQTPLNQAIQTLEGHTSTIIMTSWSTLREAGFEKAPVTAQVDALDARDALQQIIAGTDHADAIRIEQTSAFLRVTTTEPGKVTRDRVRAELERRHGPAPASATASADQANFEHYAAEGEAMSTSSQFETAMQLRAMEDRILQNRGSVGLSDYQRALIGAQTRPGPGGGIVTPGSIYVGRQIPYVSDLQPVVGAGGAIAFNPEISVINEGVGLSATGTVSPDGRYVTLTSGASLVGNVEFRRVPIFAATPRELRRGFIEVPTGNLVQTRSTIFAPARRISPSPATYRAVRTPYAPGAGPRISPSGASHGTTSFGR